MRTALVIFGATGDLAYQQIFPALQSMERHGHLDVPIICVARPGWTLEPLRARMRQSIADHGGVDDAVFDRLAARLQYVAGEYHEARDVRSPSRGAWHRANGRCSISRSPSACSRRSCRPRALGLRGRTAGDRREAVRREVSRPPRRSTRRSTNRFRRPSVYRIDHFLGKEPVQNLLYFRFANTFLEPIWNSTYVDSCQILLSEAFGVRGRGRFYEEVGAIRDVFQNHLLQVLTLLAMEPPAGERRRRDRRGEGRAAAAVRPLEPRRRRARAVPRVPLEPDVAPRSRVETYVAARLEIDNPRWAGVPFWIRSGKCLAVTANEVNVRLKKPMAALFDAEAASSRNRVQLPSESRTSASR